MSDNVEDLLQGLGEMLVHREGEINDLSDMVSQQWKRIEALEREIERTKDRIISLEDEVGDGVEANVKPPHW